MLGNIGRATATKILSPIARVLLRLRISPDLVTIAGTLGVVVLSLWLFPTGKLALGAALIALLALADSLDGTMARMSGRSSKWGAFLDSTLDRVGDAAIFAGLAIYYVEAGGSKVTALLALACLVFGAVVSYARARAEGLGMTASVGIAERADRLVVTLLTTLAVGLGAPTWVMTVALGLLAVASIITIVQRMLTVRKQAMGAEA